MSKKTIILLAGSAQEATNFLWFRERERPNQMKLEKYVYAPKAEMLYGLRADDIRIIGTFASRPDSCQIFEVAEASLINPYYHSLQI